MVADPWGGIMSEGSTGADGGKVSAGLGWIGFLHLLRRRKQKKRSPQMMARALPPENARWSESIAWTRTPPF